jgi:hypothetical protein
MWKENMSSGLKNEEWMRNAPPEETTLPNGVC